MNTETKHHRDSDITLPSLNLDISVCVTERSKIRMKQHQIMAFVGNGFDVAVLNKYGKGVTTSYESFYAFFQYRYPNRLDNSLIVQMKEARDKEKKNWGDFEAILGKKLKSITDKEEIEKLAADLNEIQRAFSRFLNDVIDGDVIDRISKSTRVLVPDVKYSSAKIDYPIRSLSCFLEDLSEQQYRNMRFHNKIDNNEYLKYEFVNFNYTALLDNYIYLDKEIFNPEPHITSYNNFRFYSNPNKIKPHTGHNDPYMRLLPIEIIHPHGYQNIPKSLLFGTESEVYNNPKDLRRIFVKSFWAQDSERYGEHFEQASLFIIWGCSMGESDSWWWSRIFNRLIADDPAELIIYNYGDEKDDTIKNLFIKGCDLKDSNAEILKRAKKNIYVVNFGPKVNKEVAFLNVPDIE